MQISNEIVIFLAQYLIFFSVLIVPYLWIKREQHDLIRIVVTVVIAFAISELLKTLTSAPRPFVVGGFDPLITVPARGFYASLPSGHTVFLAALGTAVIFTEKAPGLFLLAMAGMVGWGRVLVGVHYPLDVFWGFVIGMIVAGFFKVAHDRFPVW